MGRGLSPLRLLLGRSPSKKTSHNQQQQELEQHVSPLSSSPADAEPSLVTGKDGGARRPLTPTTNNTLFDPAVAQCTPSGRGNDTTAAKHSAAKVSPRPTKHVGRQNVAEGGSPDIGGGQRHTVVLAGGGGNKDRSSPRTPPLGAGAEVPGWQPHSHRIMGSGARRSGEGNENAADPSSITTNNVATGRGGAADRHPLHHHRSLSRMTSRGQLEFDQLLAMGSGGGGAGGVDGGGVNGGGRRTPGRTRPGENAPDSVGGAQGVTGGEASSPHQQPTLQKNRSGQVAGAAEGGTGSGRSRTPRRNENVAPCDGEAAVGGERLPANEAVVAVQATCSASAPPTTIGSVSKGGKTRGQWKDAAATGEAAAVVPKTPRQVARVLAFGGGLNNNNNCGPLGPGAGGGCRMAPHRPLSSLANGISQLAPLPALEHFDLDESWDPSREDQTVQVLVRIRPINSREASVNGDRRCLRQDSPRSLVFLTHPEPQRFTFDHVAGEQISQDKLFRVAGYPMVENCLEGYNSCMFAYGQTGSGKTYTMLGDIDDLLRRKSEQRGITPRVFEHLFSRIREEEDQRRHEQLRFQCKCSFLEIYNETITDLLDPTQTNLQIREDMKRGVYVESLSEIAVGGVEDVIKLLMEGAANRKVAQTNMNRESSRSHSVFTCVIESKGFSDGISNLRFSRLNLVDLAGSERQKSSGAEGERLKEAANINKSLSQLGYHMRSTIAMATLIPPSSKAEATSDYQGIALLSKGQHKAAMAVLAQAAVPDSASKLLCVALTHLGPSCCSAHQGDEDGNHHSQDSLGGNSKTVMIANVSPSLSCFSETLGTLKFAQRAKFIRNKAVVNEDSSGDVAYLNEQIRRLKEELSRLRGLPPPISPSARRQSLQASSTMVLAQALRSSMDSFDLTKSLLPAKDTSATASRVRALEAMLAGAFRREQSAENQVKQQASEIEHLEQLVKRMEQEANCGRMVLKFREDKIRRLEVAADGLLMTNADEALQEENANLLQELQVLRERAAKPPEVMKFASENLRLLGLLNKDREFYENGERELMKEEIAALRDELTVLLDSRNVTDFSNRRSSIFLSKGGGVQHLEQCGDGGKAAAVASHMAELSRLEVDALQKDLAECRRNLSISLETNAKMARQVDELRVEIAKLHEERTVIEAETASLRAKSRESIGIAIRDIQGPSAESAELLSQLAETDEKLEAEIDKRRAAEAALKNALDKIARLRTELNETKQGVAGAEDVLERLREAEYKLRIAEEKTNQSTDILEILKGEKRAMEECHKNQMLQLTEAAECREAEFASREIELHKDIEALKLQIELLQNANTHFQARQEMVSSVKASNMNKEENEEISNHDQQLQNLKDALALAEKEKSALTERVDEIELEIADLVQREKQEREVLEKERYEIAAKVDDLQALLQEKASCINNLTVKLQEEADTAKELRAEVDRLQVRIEEMEDEKKVLEEELEVVKEELHQEQGLRELRDEKEIEVAAREARLEVAEERKARRAAEVARDELSRELDAARKEGEELRNALRLLHYEQFSQRQKFALEDETRSDAERETALTLEALHEEWREAKENARTAAEREDSMVRSLEKATKDLAQKDIEIRTLRKRLQDANANVRALQRDAVREGCNWEDDWKEGGDENADVIGSLRKKLEAGHSRLTEVVAEKNRLLEELQELRGNAALADCGPTSSQKINCAEEKKTVLERMVEAAKAEVDETRRTLEARERELEDERSMACRRSEERDALSRRGLQVDLEDGGDGDEESVGEADGDECVMPCKMPQDWGASVEERGMGKSDLIAELEKTIATLETERDEALAKAAVSEKERDDARRSVVATQKKAEKTVEEMRILVDLAHQAAAMAEERVEEARKEKAVAEMEVDGVKEQLSDAERRRREKEVDLERLRRKWECVLMELREMEDGGCCNRDVMKEGDVEVVELVGRMRERMDELRSKIFALAEEKENQERLAEERNAEVVNLTAKVKELNSHLLDVQERADKAEESSSTEKIKVDRLREQLIEAEKKLNRTAHNCEQDRAEEERKAVGTKTENSNDEKKKSAWKSLAQSLARSGKKDKALQELKVMVASAREEKRQVEESKNKDVKTAMERAEAAEREMAVARAMRKKKEIELHVMMGQVDELKSELRRKTAQMETLWRKGLGVSTSVDTSMVAAGYFTPPKGESEMREKLHVLEDKLESEKRKSEVLEMELEEMRGLVMDAERVRKESEGMLARESSLREQLALKTIKMEELEMEMVDLRAVVMEIEDISLDKENMIERERSLIEELDAKRRRVDELELILDVKGGLTEQDKDGLRIVDGLKADMLRLHTEKEEAIKEAETVRRELDAVTAQAEEREAVAAEARQIAEHCKAVAEEREAEMAEVMRLRGELESKIASLQDQILQANDEVERQRVMKEEREREMLIAKRQMAEVQQKREEKESEVASYAKEVLDCKTILEENQRSLEEKEVELLTARNEIQKLAATAEAKKQEADKWRSWVNEMKITTEIMEAEYQQKVKALESELAESQNRLAPRSGVNFLSPLKGGTPFEQSSLESFSNTAIQRTPQVLPSADKEDAALLRKKLEEAEREISSLNWRLAEASGMTHDVLRSILGMKMEVSQLQDTHIMHEAAEKARRLSMESKKKDQELAMIRERLEKFISEREGWLEEMNRSQAEACAARVSAEKNRQANRVLVAQNEKLKAQESSLQKRVTALETDVRKLSGQQNLSQRIHHHVKIKEENNKLKAEMEALEMKSRREGLYLARALEELAKYRAAEGKLPELNFDEEQRLRQKLQEVEEEKLQIARNLNNLCQSIYQASGAGRFGVPTLASAMEALQAMIVRTESSERELASLKLQAKIVSERRQLSELRSANTPQKSMPVSSSPSRC
ncbi:hypothetical protein CBR_g88546 [Chara braunii]|uniref:Kinesin motor domain-containing protein n=1 Tax=Chara braunii TaxID=69332 RepID=A0A388KB47_CHABU|nr:hypothetical protein CBR_g88546 [Chara braunii]|eukprot:GBG67257.1 hypothetical protein CBR_g88546 [Chara braunii]